MKISENTSVAMPIKNMVGIIVGVAMGVFAYTEVTARLTSLETSRELFQADLLKKSEQLPTDQEQFMLLEDLYKTVEKIETRIEDMMVMVMVEMVIALLMIVNGEIKEHRIQESMSSCLKGKRVAMRSNTGNNVEYQCIKSKAETEIYLGAKSIKKLILK